MTNFPLQNRRKAAFGLFKVYKKGVLLKNTDRSKIMEMQALIEEIAFLLEKVKSGTATLSELEAFASATQQLNERAIILRYKAIEAKVYGTSNPCLPDRQALSDRKPSTYDEPENDPGSDVVNDKEPIEMSAPASVEDSGDLSFDLFSMDDSAPIHEPEPQSSLAIEEKEEEIIDEPAAIIVPETKEETPVTETPAQAEPVAYTETDIQPEPTLIQPEQPAYPESDVQPEPTPAPATVSLGNEHPVIQRALRNDGSLQSRLLSVRLETLKSAFGLNERMLIIRELFGGSNDTYNEAIEQLDNQPSINEARSKVSAYANQYGWGEDNELAIEFVQKVERRYA